MAKANGLDYDKAFILANMVKYSSFILIASMFCLTVSCIGGASGTSDTTASEKFMKDLSDGLKDFVTDLTDISTSSNVFVKMMVDMTDGMIEQYDKDKKQIQSAVTKGTEMEKKIQSVLQSLKNSTIPLSKELQAEIDAIGKHATDELKNLKGMENDRDIEGIETGAKAKHADIKVKIQELFKWALTLVPKADQTSSTNNETKVQEFKAKLLELKKKLFAIVHSSVPAALGTAKNEDTIHKKMKTTFTALSKIRNDLDRVDQIQYNLLRSCKAHSGTDASFLTSSLLTPFVFAILLGMVF